jgi:hypothetical protein
MAEEARPSETSASSERVLVTPVSETGGTEVVLSDGTVLNLKAAITEVVRMKGKYDQNGFPVYQIRAGLTPTVVKANDELKKH